MTGSITPTLPQVALLPSSQTVREEAARALSYGQCAERGLRQGELVRHAAPDVEVARDCDEALVPDVHLICIAHLLSLMVLMVL